MKLNKILKRKLKIQIFGQKKNNYERYSNLIPTWQLLRDLRRLAGLGFDRYRCNNGTTKKLSIKERKKEKWMDSAITIY